jgi:SAM-dependent methyltransferase
LLDVGCGVGDSLVQARSAGWRCTGIEISEKAAAIARARGFDIIVGDATDVEYPPTLFDIVRCWHTLEHVKDPVKLLGKLRDAVRPDGVVQLLLPNPRSLTSILFRRYWYHLDVPRHLHHFRPGDVAALAQKVGLHIRRIRHTASPSGLLGSIDIVVVRTTGYAVRLRSKSRLRSFTRIVTWPAARVGLADVVEYELARSRVGASSHG